jgi:hypothetical protein
MVGVFTGFLINEISLIKLISGSVPLIHKIPLIQIHTERVAQEASRASCAKIHVFSA